MYAESGALLTLADVVITWQDRMRLPFEAHGLQMVCSMLVGGVLGLLGCFVVLRRMALIGDAISHAVLPGVVIAFLLSYTGVMGLFVGALGAGILTAVFISIVTRFSRAKEDSAIGIVFTAMFAVGIVLISRLPTGTHFDMKCFLFGEAMAIQQSDLISILIVSPIVIGTITLLFHPLKLMTFDETLARTMGFNTTALHYLIMVLLSATIVAALRSVGVIMAVAMLITPAAFAYQVTNRLWSMLFVAGLAGALSAGVGMFLAFLTNDPPGAIMVLVATGLFLLGVVFGPERGLLTAWIRRNRMRAHILEEDVLKALARHELDPSHAPGQLATALTDVSSGRLSGAVDRLRRGGLLEGTQQTASLTGAGRERAYELVRSHRLWEAYLATEADDHELVHREAERLEHAHHLAEQLAASLGDPDVDPQGRPIPPAERKPSGEPPR